MTYSSLVIALLLIPSVGIGQTNADRGGSAETERILDQFKTSPDMIARTEVYIAGASEPFVFEKVRGMDFKRNFSCVESGDPDEHYGFAFGEAPQREEAFWVHKNLKNTGLECKIKSPLSPLRVGGVSVNVQRFVCSNPKVPLSTRYEFHPDTVGLSVGFLRSGGRPWKAFPRWEFRGSLSRPLLKPVELSCWQDARSE